MPKYDWDKKLIQNYRLNPLIADDFEYALDFLDGVSDQDACNLSPLRVIGKDCNFFELNPYLEEAYDRIITLDTSYLTTPFDRTKLSIDEALEMTSALYHSMDSTILNPFLIHYEKRFTHLKISKVNPFKPYGEYTGHCYCSEVAKDCLIQAWYNKNFKILLTLVHEYAHAIACTLRNYRFMNESNIVFAEIESLFMELVAINWFLKNYKYETALKKEAIKFYNEIIHIAIITLETNDLCAMVMDMHYQGRVLDFKSILKQAKENFDDMDKAYATKLLKSPIDELTIYGYSGLIAIELYLIYLQNDKEALDIYKRIICSNKDTPAKMNFVLNQMGITPGQHFKDFARTLKR